jgi:hypothetical protein
VTRLPETFRSLRYPDFSAFFGAQTISHVGSLGVASS